MLDRYWLYQRANGKFYLQDKLTGRQESLKTSDRSAAERIVAGRNQAVEMPMLNRTMAKAYLSGKSPELATRTWADVMEHYVKSGVESTQERKERAFRSAPFQRLRKVALMDTEADHLLMVLDHKKAGNSALHYLRRLHNYALHLGWLLSPVMADAAWPLVRRSHHRAITWEEHQKIVAREQNPERKLYFEVLWETGGAQSDIANLSWERIDRNTKTIRFHRQKLSGQDSGFGGMTCLCIGSRLQTILDQLPQSGFLFPTLRLQEAKDRAGYFRKARLSCKIQGITLHSYRYAWAERAKTAGMPERDAMNHLGHKSRAIHAAYASSALVTVLPLEFYEAQKAKNVVQFISESQRQADATVLNGERSHHG